MRVCKGAVLVGIQPFFEASTGKIFQLAGKVNYFRCLVLPFGGDLDRSTHCDFLDAMHQPESMAHAEAIRRVGRDDLELRAVS
jgi:hypothetical protein